MKKINLIILSCLLPVVLFANGGPMDWSSIRRTGSVVMKHVYDVTVQSERIDLKVEGDYSVYDIVYLFKKKRFSSEPDTVTYGFPVDFSPNYRGDYVFENSYIPYFKMMFQGKELPILEQIDFNQYVDGDSTHSYQIYKRKWYISKLVFDKESVYELRVQYKVKNQYLDYIYSKSIEPQFHERYLKYDMFPSSYWGEEGVIDTLTVRINVQNLDSCGEKYELYSGLEGNTFANGIFEYRKLKFDLGVHHGFEMYYTNKLQSYSNYIMRSRLPDSLIKSVRSHPGADKINLGHLLDADFSSCFKNEKPFKSGQNWLEFEFDTAEISGIYFFNQDFNGSSNQIAKIRVELWGTSKWMDSDEEGNQSKEINEKMDFNVVLKKHPRKNVNQFTFSDNADLILDYALGGLSVKKIRITILDISGDKSKGFSIPEIIFTDYQWFNKNNQN